MDNEPPGAAAEGREDARQARGYEREVDLFVTMPDGQRAPDRRTHLAETGHLEHGAQQDRSMRPHRVDERLRPLRIEHPVVMLVRLVGRVEVEPGDTVHGVAIARCHGRIGVARDGRACRLGWRGHKR